MGEYFKITFTSWFPKVLTSGESLNQLYTGEINPKVTWGECVGSYGIES